jgi:hypothetical protein
MLCFFLSSWAQTICSIKRPLALWGTGIDFFLKIAHWAAYKFLQLLLSSCKLQLWEQSQINCSHSEGRPSLQGHRQFRLLTNIYGKLYPVQIQLIRNEWDLSQTQDRNSPFLCLVCNYDCYSPNIYGLLICISPSLLSLSKDMGPIVTNKISLRIMFWFQVAALNQGISKLVPWKARHRFCGT